MSSATSGKYAGNPCSHRRDGMFDGFDRANARERNGAKRNGAALRTEAGDVPFIAEFTFGEYGYEADGLNTCGGLMLSFTAFEA